ncbi:MAG TPA: hypothetical protein VFD84_02845 [Candidatus Binatia bacterium]|nr:hypothetical protein [Candidatus Binatia bacterium]
MIRRPRPPLDVALAATLHDPQGALRGEIEWALPRLAALYRGVAVAASPTTSPRLRALLAEAGVAAPADGGDLRGPLYRRAIRAALAHDAGHVHYLDLDRALHWQRRAPREHAAVVRVARRFPVLVVGRTPAAHRAHHLPLFATEALVNRLMTARLGIAGRVDFLVPSFVLARDAARALVAGSRARDAAIYGELAALVVGLAPETAYVECRGLDWETPDRHRRAVRRLGLPAWRRRHETPAEWALRVRLARDILVGFDRTLARRERRPVTLRRLTERVG